MSLAKPTRSKGESNVMWISRRDSYRLALIEEQIKQLQADIKTLSRGKN